MIRPLVIISVLLYFSFSQAAAIAGDDAAGSVLIKAPVSIGNIGIQNLEVAISYQPISQDEQLLQTTRFSNFMKMLRVEMQGIAMREILGNPYVTLDSMGELAQLIQARISENIEKRVTETFPDKGVVIPVSISRLEFYSTKRSTLSIQETQ